MFNSNLLNKNYMRTQSKPGVNIQSVKDCMYCFTALVPPIVSLRRIGITIYPKKNNKKYFQN